MKYVTMYVCMYVYMYLNRVYWPLQNGLQMIVVRFP